MTAVKRLTLALLLAVATLVPVGSLSPASAANTDNCRGHISSFYKSNGRVYLHYRVTCDRKQEKIGASSFLRKAASDVHVTEYRTCKNVSFCTAVASLADKRGSQLYYARTDESTLEVPATYAQRRYLVVCGTRSGNMRCGAGSKSF